MIIGKIVEGEQLEMPPEYYKDKISQIKKEILNKKYSYEKNINRLCTVIKIDKAETKKNKGTHKLLDTV